MNKCPICHAESVDEARTLCHSGWKNTPEYANDCPGTLGKYPFTPPADQGELPPLPPMALTIAGDDPDRGHYYTAEQLHEYARAALAALRVERDGLEADYLRRHKDACDRAEEIFALKAVLAGRADQGEWTDERILAIADKIPIRITGRYDESILRFARAILASRPCVVNPYSSRACELGTKGCDVVHASRPAGGEPVAWLVDDTEGHRATTFTDPQSAEGAYDGWIVMPLFAHPPAVAGELSTGEKQ